MSIRSKILLLLLTFTVAVIAGSGIFSTIALDNYFHDRLLRELTAQIRETDYYIRTGIISDTSAYRLLRDFSRTGDYRLTLIDSAGTVLFDSDIQSADIAKAGNHLSRIEIAEAKKNGTGTVSRHSTTLDVDMLYLAKKITASYPHTSFFSAASYIRIGIPLTNVSAVMDDIRSTIIVTSAAVLFFVIVVSIAVSQWMSSPLKTMAVTADMIRKGDLSRRIEPRSQDELGLLAVSINSMVDTLNDDIVRLKKLEQVRTEFLANVSHEIRTPIFSIQGLLEILSAGAVNDPAVNKDFVDRSLANVKRLDLLLEDLINISRIESGDMKMSFRFFDLSDFLYLMTEETKELAALYGITLSLTNCGESVEAYGDRDRLKQVIGNLLSNAIKYNRSGGFVELSSSFENNRVRVSIKDNGPGIDAIHLPRIFERFYRIDRERSREKGGTGLGLAIVKHIIEAHGSAVDVSSVVGAGSNFSFTLLIGNNH